MSHCDESARLFVEIQDGVHHQELFLHGDTGVIFVKCILLQESQTDHTGNLQNKLLIIRKDIASDQLDDLKQAAFLIQKGHQAVAVIHKFWRHVILIPVAQIIQILAVTGQPVDCREMSGIRKTFVKSPEAAHKTFGVLRYRFGKIASLRRDRSDYSDGTVRSV